MNVLLTSTSYPRDAEDWRGVFIFHMVASLARHHDVCLKLWAPPGVLPPHVENIVTTKETRWLGGLMEDGGVSHLLRKQPLTGLLTGFRLLRALRGAFRRMTDVDLYHINWLQCALPLPHDRKPVLITVLGNDMNLLRLPFMKALLTRVMRDRPVVLCPNANWMEAPLRDVFGEFAKVASVPFGIDSRWYAVDRKPISGLPSCWLVVTRLTAKKLGFLFEWSKALFANGKRDLHLFGPMQENVHIPDWVHYHGPIAGDTLAREWFPRAQGLITLSRHAEGRPQVMLEAMAAGLPIIATRMPAHEDIVQDGRTGVLCDTAHQYVSAVEQTEEPVRNSVMGEAARAWVRHKLGTWDNCAQRYTDLYTDLCKERAE